MLRLCFYSLKHASTSLNGCSRAFGSVHVAAGRHRETSASELQRRQVFNVGRLAFAVEGDDQGETTATSAAATVMMKKTMTWPSRLFLNREKATRAGWPRST